MQELVAIIKKRSLVRQNAISIALLKHFVRLYQNSPAKPKTAIFERVGKK